MRNDYKIILWLITVISGAILAVMIPPEFKYALGIFVGWLITKEIEWIVEGE